MLLLLGRRSTYPHHCQRSTRNHRTGNMYPGKPKQPYPKCRWVQKLDLEVVEKLDLDLEVVDQLALEVVDQLALEVVEKLDLEVEQLDLR